MHGPCGAREKRINTITITIMTIMTIMTIITIITITTVITTTTITTATIITTLIITIIIIIITGIVIIKRITITMAHYEAQITEDEGACNMLRLFISILQAMFSQRTPLLQPEIDA